MVDITRTAEVDLIGASRGVTLQKKNGISDLELRSVRAV